MKRLTLYCFALFLIGIALFLIQLWFSPWSEATFIKFILTDGALFVACAVWAFLVRENKETEKINKGSGLD